MTSEIDPVHIPPVLFGRAKSWFAGALGLRLLGMASGLATLDHRLAPAAPYAVAVLAAAAEFVAWRSDVLKSKAERALRMTEWQDGLGVMVDREELFDVTSAYPITDPPKSVEPYFSSLLGPSPERLATNLRESSWWTRNLCTSMFRLVAAVTVVVVLASVSFLLWNLTQVATDSARSAAARIATSMLMTIVSLGFVRLAYSYSVLASRAERAGREAKTLAKGGFTQIDAIRALYEYQLARATGPLIPDTIYKFRRSTLNKLWQEIVAQPSAVDKGKA
jgi:hypothetical protein